MRKGIRGNWQPENAEEFLRLKANAGLKFHACVSCMEDFNPDNTQTKAGWRETQISGMCEECFDALYPEDEESGEIQ